MSRNRLAVIALTALAGASHASDGLRVAAWNISNYSGGHASTIATAVYGSHEGRRFDPDVILLQEMLSAGAVDSLALALNAALGEPGEWVAAPFYGGSSGGLNTALVYRESKLDLVGSELVWPGGPPPNHPRNIVRYDVRLEGYGSDEAVISCYPTHMKAGSGSDDQQRRLLEGERIRDDAESLPTGRHFILGGDFNTQSSWQAGYLELIGSQQNNAGRFFDPIATPGSWNNNWTFRYIHTQDPSGGGGMDDRHDQLLASGTLGDGEGVDYIGSFGLPWDLSTWDDANHSYRCWGNDGTTFNQAIRTTGNEMVGAQIAQALKVLAGGGGHLPVYLDLMAPARAGADESIDFGEVEIGETAEAALDVFNAGDIGLWGAGGIGDLSYELVAPNGFSAPSGPFDEAAGGGVNTHTVTMDTSAIGQVSGTLLVVSNDPETPVLSIELGGEVVNGCVADLAAPYGVLDLSDVNAFGAGFFAEDPVADLAEPFGVFDLSDINLFVDVFLAGCP